MVALTVKYEYQCEYHVDRCCFATYNGHDWNCRESEATAKTDEPHHAKRALSIILIKMFILLLSIILRLICENLSKIAVKISFLWDPKDCVYAAALFIATITLWYLHNDIKKFTSVI